MKKFLKILLIAAAVIALLATGAMALLPVIINEAMGGTAELDAPHVDHEVSAGTVDASTVYFTSDISPEGLLAIYDTLGIALNGEKIAVKISTGEPPNSNYLDPALIGDLVKLLNGTIVESNTAYGGSRSETALHYQVAEDHGYTAIADVVILDENGSIALPVSGGRHLTENLVGARFPEFDGMLVLSHFKGHPMGGFGGAIKNASIGIASTEGKCVIHTAGRSHSTVWFGDQNDFLESMAEAVSAVDAALEGNIIYINVMNNLSVDCDCNGNPDEPDIHDIGILASTDPVALDQACVDLIYRTEGSDALQARIEERNAERVLKYGQDIGLGNRAYILVSIDK